MIRRFASRLSDRDRRAATIGVVVICALVTLTKGVPAWHSWQHDAEAAATEVVVDAARADGVIAAYPELRDSLRVRTSRLRSLDASIVSGSDPAAAAASLASIVSDAANDAGVKLESVQPRVDSESRTLGTARVSSHPAFARVSVHGDAVGDVVTLTQFLAQLEHGPVLLVVRALSITQPEPEAPSSRMEKLHAEFAVVGLARAAAEARVHHDSGHKTTATDSQSLRPD
jgi:hypothetical protein